jgi:hypothetical protein
MSGFSFRGCATRPRHTGSDDRALEVFVQLSDQLALAPSAEAAPCG